MATIKQPEWCNYPDAEKQFIGCWSMQLDMVKNEDFCKDCDCNREGGKNEERT